MSTIRVLIDGAGTVTCQSVIKGLKKQKDFDVQILTMDMDYVNAGRFFSDRFFKIPPASDEEFLQSISMILKQQDVDIFIPIIDYGFKVISENRKALEDISGSLVLISSPKTIDICNDKLNFYDALYKIEGIKVCELIEGPVEGFPYFAKPRYDGRASIGCYKIESWTDFEYVKRHVDCPLFVELLKGTEYTVDTLNDFDGKFIGGVTRIRCETKSGVSYKAEVVHDLEMLEQAKKIVESLNIIGPANLQCFKDGDDITWFEINPRFSGTFAASLGAGFNSAHMILKLFSNMSITKEDTEYDDVTMLRFWDEVILDSEGTSKWISQI
jgi:carbamoyl-phosphate synthase large subunit